jgi:hypothetical protein
MMICQRFHAIMELKHEQQANLFFNINNNCFSANIAFSWNVRTDMYNKSSLTIYSIIRIFNNAVVISLQIVLCCFGSLLFKFMSLQ